MFAAEAFSSDPFASAPGFLYASEVSDLASGSEQLIGGLPVSVNVFDALSSGSDVVEARLPFSGNVFDTSSVSQETVTAVAELIATIQEHVIFAERRFIGGGFSAGSFASGSYSGLGDDIRFISGAVVSANVEVNSATSETVTALYTNRAGINFAVSSSDTASGLDIVSSIPEYPGVVSESAAGSETVSSIPTYLCQIQELTAASVTGATLVELGSLISEVATGLDTPASLFNVNAAVAETATQIDRPFTQYITRPVVADMAQARDLTEARLQWENINTFETADWVLIDTNK